MSLIDLFALVLFIAGIVAGALLGRGYGTLGTDLGGAAGAVVVVIIQWLARRPVRRR